MEITWGAIKQYNDFRVVADYTRYSWVSNNRAAHLFVLEEFFFPTCPYLKLNNSK